MPRRKLDLPNFHVKLRRGKYALSFTHLERGTTVYRSLGTDDKATAERRKSALVRDILQELYGGKAPAHNDYFAGEMLAAYEKRRGTDKDSTYYALKPLRHFFGGFKVSQLRNDDIWNDYRVWRIGCDQTRAMSVGSGMKVSDATACRELRTMRAAINWARRNGWDGLQDVKVYVPNASHDAIDDHLTRGELKAPLKACTTLHQRLYVRLAVATGARMSVILNLKWEDVRWPQNRRSPDEPADMTPTSFTTDESIEYFDELTGEYHYYEGRDFELELKPGMRLNLG